MVRRGEIYWGEFEPKMSEVGAALKYNLGLR